LAQPFLVLLAVRGVSALLARCSLAAAHTLSGARLGRTAPVWPAQ
jgi:hypothetical protein